MRSLNRIINKSLLCLEKSFSKNWFNPFATLYINLRSMPFKQAIRLPIWVYGRPVILGLSGNIIINGEITSGMIRINFSNNGPQNMNIQTEIGNFGTIIFNGRAFIRTGNRILINYGGTLEIGDNFIMGDLINIGCLNRITIGKNVRIAHRSQIFDSNYHYVANLNKGIVPPITKPINIGAYSWICNTTTINAGTTIPPATIISSNSVVNKDFSNIPEGSIIGGIPAKLIASGFRLVNNRNKEHEISEHYHNSYGETFCLPEEIDYNDWFNLQ